MGSLITSLKVYFPGFVLSENEICSAFGKDAPKKPSVRRVANFDEDVITMAQQAASECLADAKETPDSILFCSTTLPASTSVSFLPAALNLSPAVPVTVIGGSWRCAIHAMDIASRIASQGEKVLLIASETLSKFSLSNPFTPFADCAAAAWIAPPYESHSYLFEIDTCSSASDIFEPLVCGEDPATIFDDARLTAVLMSHAVGSALDRMEKPQAFAFSTFDDKIAKSVCKIPQVGKASLVEDPIHQVGFAGCVQPFLLLSRANLETGSLLHLAAYGSGASVISLKVGKNKPEASSRKERAVKGFEKFREIRDFLQKSESMRAAFASQAILSRDQDLLLGFQGLVCEGCSRIFTIPQNVCPACREAGKFTRKVLSRFGTVFTFTHEYYIPTPSPPVTMVVVDLDGGGRVTVQATDCTPDEIAVGSRVQVVLRRYHSGGGLPNYYWKAAPV